MTDPIKIMDEIELKHNYVPRGWADLRTAIKRQNERIDMLKSQAESLAQEALDKSDELAQARVRIGALADELKKAVDAASYVVQICEQDVKDGESSNPHVKSCPSAVMAHCYGAMRFSASAQQALSESEPQSLAALKAEALREFGDKQRDEPGKIGVAAMVRQRAYDEAESIEREAKES